ncbi:DEAD-box ATP-dependent RNA helicase 31 [Forsythia ovata]|uniref:ATP-dependent RNA helicase n=1 Tax=Forsythia ovata TaxID=205694 RepID=A0ABD1VJ34_9LAMI
MSTGLLPVARLSTSYTAKYGPPVALVMPVFSRIFPQKLKFRFFEPPFLPSYQVKGVLINQVGIRKFSVRSERTRSGSGHEVRVAKSLIEDEAELSDWVSGLSSNSLRKTQVYSDSDVDGNNGGDNGGYRNRERGEKRRRKDSESDNGAFDFPSGRGGSRGLEKPFSRGRGGYGGRLEENRRDYNGGGLFAGRGGTRNSSESSRRKENIGGELEGKNERRGGLTSRGKGWGSVERFPGRQLGMGNDERREKSRGARGSGMGYRKDGGGGVGMKREGKRVPQRALVVTDDEEEKGEEGYRSFKELIDSDDVDDEDEDESDEEDNTVDDVFEKEKVLSQPPSLPGRSDSYLSESRFDQCSISPLSMKGLKDVGYEKMTVVQEATLPVILKGKDVLAKAKTGTGKTVAFLLPAIEVVVKSQPVARDQKQTPILVLVMCPTRELASQAAAEANTLLKYHPSIGVQVVIGGTRLTLEQKRMQANPCQILVATPGRLKDHIENTAGFATRLMGVKVLVLDEADHLLDMGFRRDIEKIIAAVPKQRQTLLFSATVPQEVRQICHIALKRDHEFINTVQEGSEETHAQVRQMHLVAPLDKHFSLLYTLLKEHIADDVNYKILVFCTTAMVTRLVAELLSELNLNVREIHSRKPQSYRTRVSDEFRKSKGLILVTSDVSARGVDYPDVTLVVQIGLPADRQQYIHRLGRTGRKGKEGQGILLLAPWEEFFLSTIKDLPLTKAPEPLVDPETRKKVERALSQGEMKNKESAYQAWLGYYNSNKNVGRDKYRLVELANEFSRTMGLDNPPAIPKLVLGKMGLKNIPGLRSR